MLGMEMTEGRWDWPSSMKECLVRKKWEKEGRARKVGEIQAGDLFGVVEGYRHAWSLLAKTLWTVVCKQADNKSKQRP